MLELKKSRTPSNGLLEVVARKITGALQIRGGIGDPYYRMSLPIDVADPEEQRDRRDGHEEQEERAPYAASDP